MSTNRTWEILDVAGAVLHQGSADTKKDLVRKLIEQGASFHGADLSDTDLSHLRIDGLDFSGANLSRARLRGATASKTNFAGSILDGVRAEGMTARQADFTNCRVGKSQDRTGVVRAIFDGAVLTHSCFAAARIDGASFEDCSMSGAAFDMAAVTHTRFRNSRLLNTEWSRADVRGCDFSHAELNASSAAMRIPRSSLPKRTIDAVAIGNNYRDAVLDETVPMFRLDRILNGVEHNIAWAASSAALLAATSMLPFNPGEEWLGKFAGQGVMVLAGAALLSMLKQRLDEHLQHRLAGVTTHLQGRVRGLFADLVRRGANMAELVAAVTRGPGLRPIQHALAATAKRARQKGIFNATASLVMGDTNIIVCDRRHLAMAFESLGSAFARSRYLERDLVVSRIGHDDYRAPSLLKFFSGGGMAAFWVIDGKISRTAEWDADGCEIAAERPASMTAIEARALFEQAALHDLHPNARLAYDPLTHQLRAGRDGAIVITGQKDKLPRNHLGPILIRTDGNSLNAKEARELVHHDDDVAPAFGR